MKKKNAVRSLPPNSPLPYNKGVLTQASHTAVAASNALMPVMTASIQLSTTFGSASNEG